MGSMNIPDKSGIAQARYCLPRKRWNQRKVRFFWTSLKHSRPGPNYRSSFSQAAANRAGQDYSDLAAAAAGTVTLLERPISTLTLIRSVQVALRSRRRQYQVRDLVTQLANLNETLEQRVAKRTAEAVEQAQKLRLLSAELSLAEEAERRRIAEMLHEDLQQLLVAARMQLAALCRTQDAAQREPIAREIADVLERSFQLTRSLSVELAPPVLYRARLSGST